MATKQMTRLIRVCFVTVWLMLHPLTEVRAGHAKVYDAICFSVRLTSVDLAASGFMLAAAERRGGCRD